VRAAERSRGYLGRKKKKSYTKVHIILGVTVRFPSSLKISKKLTVSREET
jgi:hypothetical protein